MLSNDTLRILMLHESRDDAEQILNRIRNSGRATRAELLDSDEALNEALEKSTWDLMLLRPVAEELFAGTCLLQVQKLQKDIPAILLIDELDPEEIVEGLREGYKAVVPIHQEEWLLQTIRRELNNLEERRKRRHVVFRRNPGERLQAGDRRVVAGLAVVGVVERRTAVNQLLTPT